MSNLIELLTNSKINIKNNKKIKPSQNFIMQLLKDLEPKKAIDLLKELKLSKEDIKKLILKLPKKEQQTYLELLKNLENNSPISKNLKNTSSKKIKTDLPIFENSKTNSSNFKDLKTISSNSKINSSNLKKPKTDLPIFKDSKETKIKHQKSNLNSLNNEKNQDEKDLKETENIKLENILHLFTDKTSILHTSNLKTENPKQTKLKLIKKEIEINLRKSKNLETQKIITQIKNASSIEELINIANKNDLNIKKIILKTINSNIASNQTTPTQINPVKNIKIAENNKLKNFVKANHTKNKSSNLIQTILKQKIQKNIKQNENNTTNTLNTINTNISTMQSNEKNILKTLLSKNQKEDNQTSHIINLTNIHTEIKHKIITAKESIKHFSNKLKEAIENYKPPVSKLSLELHPKELGKVEVTIIHRGENLQININSNNQAINFFHTNQTELKNTLINLGYNGVDMNFNSNQQNKEKAHKQYSSHKKKEEDYDELVIEIPYTYA